jgi:hypothetical protein
MKRLLERVGRVGRRVSVVRVIALMAALLHCSGPVVAAQQDDDKALLERRVKAAFIFQFLNYVEWPEGTFPQSTANIVIAVAGDDELAGEIGQIVSTRTMSGRPVIVRKAKMPESLADVHLLFVGRGEMAALPQWVKMARSRPVLIITEAAGALDHGSMINFQLIQNRLRFEISLDAIDRHGLKVSSRLLAVAQSVRRTTVQ